jgi:hypothetical protein
VRLGCFGCFFIVIGILALVVLVGGAVFLSLSLFGTPDVRSVAFSKADGYAAQQKLYEVVLRQAGRSGRKDSIILLEREANAFLSRHLAESAGIPLSPLIIRFEKGYVFAQGQTPLRNLFQGPPFAQLIPYVPDARLNQPAWVTIRATISVESGSGNTRYGNVNVTEFELGRQHVGSFLLYVMMGPSGAGLFHWQVPSIVDSIQIEDGQAIIRTR